MCCSAAAVPNRESSRSNGEAIPASHTYRLPSCRQPQFPHLRKNASKTCVRRYTHGSIRAQEGEPNHQFPALHGTNRRKSAGCQCPNFVPCPRQRSSRWFSKQRSSAKWRCLSDVPRLKCNAQHCAKSERCTDCIADFSPPRCHRAQTHTAPAGHIGSRSAPARFVCTRISAEFQLSGYVRSRGQIHDFVIGSIRYVKRES